MRFSSMCFVFWPVVSERQFYRVSRWSWTLNNATFCWSARPSPSPWRPSEFWWVKRRKHTLASPQRWGLTVGGLSPQVLVRGEGGWELPLLVQGGRPAGPRVSQSVPGDPRAGEDRLGEHHAISDSRLKHQWSNSSDLSSWSAICPPRKQDVNKHVSVGQPTLRDHTQ